MNSQPTLADWLALVRTPGIGPRRGRRLLARFGNPALVRAAPWGELRGLGLSEAALQALTEPTGLEADLDWALEPDQTLLPLTDPRYPARLRDLPDSPLLLYVKGDPAWLAWPQIAVVGSRNPSSAGCQTARQFGRALAERGLAVTSGLATGIDGCAHEGALETGGTLAVMGTGLDRVYPSSHRALAHRIAGQGALVSEFAIGTPARPENFPRRNRIISGLSLGVLVVEAGLRSGSLITARLAAEQGREVFAIPGSLYNPLATGCHALIKQGAKLTEGIDDILEEIGPLLDPAAVVAPHVTAGDEALLVGSARVLWLAIGFDAISTDELTIRLGMP
ncbi:MAG: DNA-processing protein DprA, partial [Pseudomonadota bacterium]